jgi:hypothetical protein
MRLKTYAGLTRSVEKTEIILEPSILRKVGGGHDELSIYRFDDSWQGSDHEGVQ